MTEIYEGIMKNDVELLGTEFSLKRGQKVEMIKAANQPDYEEKGLYFVRPRTAETNNEWDENSVSILLDNSDFNFTYSFRQNNSGGFFTGVETPDESIGFTKRDEHFPEGQHLFIYAGSANEANELALGVAGVYFNGITLGRDCSCCGDRWHKVSDDSCWYGRVTKDDF